MSAFAARYPFGNEPLQKWAIFVQPILFDRHNKVGTINYYPPLPPATIVRCETPPEPKTRKSGAASQRVEEELID